MDKEIRDLLKLSDSFNKQPKNIQRMIIAADVIIQIEAGRYIPKSGVYLGVLSPGGDYIAPKFYRSSKKNKKVAAIIKDCYVCEVGGLFLSSVSLNNSFSGVLDSIYSRITDDGKLKNHLKKYFSKEQLNDIEEAFEWNDNIDNYFEERAKYFHNQKTIRNRRYRSRFNLDDDKDAMIHILKNLIRNKGFFNTLYH